MSRKLWKRWLWTGALAAAALPAGLTLAQEDDAQPAAKPVPPRIIERAAEGAEAAGAPLYAFVEGDTEALPTSDYWIGVGLDRELPPLVREQLGIEHGLVVIDPFPESPAAKAGIQQHDILTKAGDTPLKEPADLIKAVDAAKESELKLTLIRGGKEMIVTVTPTKRPQPEQQELALKVPTQSPELQEEIKRLEDVLQKLKGKAGGDGLSLSFVHPPILARTKVLAQTEFPKDLRVQITKEGEGPATIKVKQGDKEWEVTEDKLGELPPEVRKHVESMRASHGAMRFPMAVPPPSYTPHTIRVTPEGKVEGRIQFSPNAAPDGTQAHALRWTQVHGGTVDAELDAILKKLDHMESQALEQLQQEVEQLRKDLDEVRGSKLQEK
jgi:hypothetical protein